MQISVRALFTGIHGILFGWFFIAAIFTVVVELIRSSNQTRPSELTARGYTWARIYLVLTVAAGWVAVFLGAYVVYPWYRAIPPAGLTNLSGYPQALLQSSPTTSDLHELGMEWKEHVAWFAPIVMTAVVYVLLRCRSTVRNTPRIRAAVLTFALFALIAAGIAGFWGAMLDKTAPVEGGTTIHLMGGQR